MKKINRVLIITLIIFIILLLGIGGFVYAYLATDFLKSNQELFFKYFSQIIDEENSFFDSNIENYFNKKEQTPYENEGDIRVSSQFPEGVLSDNLVESVNNLNFRFSGKKDNARSNVEQNIEIDFGQDMVIPINYRRVGELLGLQSRYIGSKYIALENNNLKELAEKLGIDSSEIPDKIEFEQNALTIEFTQEERNQIKENYQNIIIEQTSKDNFTKSETITGMNYTLTLSPEEVKSLSINLLETFKQDTILVNKLNQYFDAIGSTNQITDEQIQDLIDEQNETDVSEFKELKITIGEQNKLLNQILIENDMNKIELIKNASNDSINYVINYQTSGDDQQVEISFGATFSGITALENVKETYELKLSATVEDETIAYDYLINNQIQFKDSINIEALNDDTALFLNDYDEATLQTLMTAIVERIGSLNSQITENLGVEETENPILYTNPFTTFSTILYNSANDAILEAQDNMAEEEKEVHNNIYNIYVGDSVRGSQVNALISTTVSSNFSETDENRKVRITLDGTELLGIDDTEIQGVDTTKQYKVEAVYDDNTEWIVEMKITTIN